MSNRERVLGELLTRLERREAALMEWGFFDVVHTADEIVELFVNDPEWGTHFRALADGSEELFIDDLAQANLLYRLEGTYPRRYRSRFAESIRLTARLRQRFKQDDWAYAPELVSQVRLHLAPRRFPVRDQNFDSVWQTVAPQSWMRPIQREALHALMSNPKPLKLAAFQIRAILRILTHYRRSTEPSGTVVTAGTGGGKTKSFYIPALMGLTADVRQDPTPATRVLALYPRNVLLADQFSEACAQVAIINKLRILERPLRVGALIGEVPLNKNFEGDGRNKWSLDAWQPARFQKGKLVPHLRHPETGESLVWTDADRRSNRTILRRDSPTGEVVFEEGMVCLTRDDLVKHPPDIFLTSIEMLNKELSGEIGRGVLGFASKRSALRMVLLDEIHTYEGLTGAQVPWILRRLAYWVKSGPRRSGLHYVGLSATLQDAPDHLAMLTGVHSTRIEEISPRDIPDEISVEGQEYNVVLKSHPGSGAGVLSSSIQVAMLGARLLTPAAAVRNPDAVVDVTAFFGRKVFGFTDNLDVVNRWLPDFKNAEEVRRLARLRTPHANDQKEDEAGQVWKLPVLLGHNLHTKLRVDRISSQDPGIEAKADVVFATSSLEVGYDDPEVGMVLQHKAPRSAASFLQRKGRAGRRQGVRPWTVVVLSDNGRDRWAFRESERLFSPVLEGLSLPVFNPYVLRIQATWFLVDWIASKVEGDIPSLYLTRANYRNKDAERWVKELIESPVLRAEFTQAMETWMGGSSGGFSVADVPALACNLLWSPPRAVLRHVIPDLWKFMNSGYVQHGRRARLLPKFLPSTTWDVLDSQDVELLIGKDRAESMDASRALYEAVPGRVSRRFVVNPHEASKWPEISARLLLQSPPTTVAIDEICGRWIRIEDAMGLDLFQPTEMAFTDAPDEVKNSSNAQWDWQLLVRRTGDGDQLGVHAEGIVAELFEPSKTWLHRDQSALRVFRYAQSCRYEVLLEKDQVCRGALEVVSPSSMTNEASMPVAIGYARSVDGLEFRIHRERLARVPELPIDLLQELRPAYLRYRASRSSALLQLASSFAIGNLCSSAIGMLVSTALRKRLSLEQAWAAIPDKAAAAVKVMRVILAIDSDSDDGDNRRIAELENLWRQEEVLTVMGELVQSLWAPKDDELEEWLRSKFVETTRAAVEAAVQAVLPEAPEGNLRVDAFTDDSGTSILVLETDPGGVGIVERLVLEISTNPDKFNRAVEWSIATCASEDSLNTVLAAVRAARSPYASMRTVFEEVRNASDYRTLDHARNALVSELRRQDLPTNKRVVTAIMSKSLGPGSRHQTDRWLDGLTRARHRVSRRLGTEVDIRSFAYWLLNHPRVGASMRSTVRMIISAEPTDIQVYEAFLRLTHESCTHSCPECLGTGRESVGLAPSRRLLQRWLGPTSLQVIDVDDYGVWMERLKEVFSVHSRVRLKHRPDQRTLVATMLAELMTSEIDRGYHSSPLRISGSRHCAGVWETDLEVDPWEGN
ncbi:protein DpdJ [Paraburkholderia sp. A1BS-2L]|uniref:protein DpdJ n=1 Tax=Paraburkholderia sp. A1BS-2L TaxID=3028373 RepID=UPI003DAA020D